MKRPLKSMALAGVMAAAAMSQAGWVQWSSGVGGNDHWYQVVLIAGNDNSWSEARTQAQGLAAGSDLATLTSAAENDFVFNLANNLVYWGNDAAGNSQGPYLGGYEITEGNWAWVTGETWSYTNWAGGEPNNSGGSENWLQFFGHGLNNPYGTWNDISNGIGGPQKSYVAETALAPVPEPATLALAASALVLARRRRKR
ncbi:MAG: PEP-CTERM sorting domain-containing protein [Fimbriimonadaceae bacterium]|nr:PEP-CTERM sorting domain-containing protein [Fimbriimonadaceae bacterium]